MKKKLILLIIILINLGSCAKPTVVDITMPEDIKLNCENLNFIFTRKSKDSACNLIIDKRR